jgi:hypothetical protein
LTEPNTAVILPKGNVHETWHEHQRARPTLAKYTKQVERIMSQKLAEVKSRLAAKYERLAAVAKSKPKKKTYLHKAQSYRRQAEQAARE